MMPEPSLQERYAPGSICFGCGPANPRGLHVRSVPAEDGPDVGGELIAVWQPEAHHEAFPGVLNGGIIGTLLDCHSNWTAACALMRRRGAHVPPPTVTAEYSIRLLRPCPSTGPLTLRARIVSLAEDHAMTEATLEAGGTVCATCRGTFVAVRPGHPAYHRWS